MSQAVEHIVCAVWGRPASRKTVTHAIDLALSSGARLTFFHVVDAEFYSHAVMGGPLSVVYDELVRMSEFVMLILCDRATRRGVEDVDYIVRVGDVRKQLRALAAETQAEVLVMGWPQPGLEQRAFKPVELEAFVQELRQVGDLQVVLVPLDGEDAGAD